jgi:hypothetical protein
MANDDTINFNSTVDYFKLYNEGSGENSSLYPATSTPSPLLTSTSPSSTVPLATATTLTITSTIINNYTSQNYSNYSTNHSHNSTINSFNQSTLYQFKNLSHNASSDQIYSNLSINDSAKISYESGSNFMLLLEDFGEYFYNYNGSDYNSTISIYQANCSLANSTCGEVNARKYQWLLYGGELMGLRGEFSGGRKLFEWFRWFIRDICFENDD